MTPSPACPHCRAPVAPARAAEPVCQRCRRTDCPVLKIGPTTEMETCTLALRDCDAPSVAAAGDAVEALPDRWRAEADAIERATGSATGAVASWMRGEIAAVRECAAELSTALRARTGAPATAGEKK